MNTIVHIDELGRKYQALSNGEADQFIIVGPPEGLVDRMGLPEPFATNLHNLLFERKIWNYEAATKAQNNLIGILQEVLMVDVQKLLEAYFIIEKL